MRRYGMYGLGAISAAAVKTAQQEINVILAQQGFQPIKADGILGPKTCGAARATAHPALASMGCTSFTDPLRSATGPAVPAPGPNAPPGTSASALAPASAPTASAAGVFGIDTKTILIGAGVVGLGVVAVYFLKKKSQAGAAA